MPHTDSHDPGTSDPPAEDSAHPRARRAARDGNPYVRCKRSSLSIEIAMEQRAAIGGRSWIQSGHSSRTHDDAGDVMEESSSKRAAALCDRRRFLGAAGALAAGGWSAV